MQLWLFLYAGGALGYGTGWFGARIGWLGRVPGLLALGLLPFWLYTAFMLAGRPTGTLREDIAWFALGAVMLSPILVSWIVGFVAALFVRRRQARSTIPSQAG